LPAGLCSMTRAQWSSSLNVKRKEPYLADAGEPIGRQHCPPGETSIRDERISEFPRLVNRLENSRLGEFSIREFVFACPSGSQFKSFGFNAPPTEHASCCAAPKPVLKIKFTHPYPNLPILPLWGTPRIPPVLRKWCAGIWPKNGARPANSCGAPRWHRLGPPFAHRRATFAPTPTGGRTAPGCRRRRACGARFDDRRFIGKICGE
jgi:hypothetical protein